jgi:SAM-dependent methyltransferase
VREVFGAQLPIRTYVREDSAAGIASFAYILLGGIDVDACDLGRLDSRPLATLAVAMTLAEEMLEHAVVYRMLQAPFAEQKFAPVLANNDLGRVRRVLDVGCGPGTNTKHFAHVDYLGIDFNERYIESARRRHGRDFIVADVRNYRSAPGDRFDFVLANSFLHHLNTEDVLGILSHMRSLLAEDGYFHTVELVMPPDRSIARLLAHWDRGDFARPLEEWRTIFTKLFEPVVFEFYPLTLMGTTLWHMVYFKGRARRD